jgi:hypothetical protein
MLITLTASTPSEDDSDDAVDAHANATPASATSWTNYRIFEEILVEISEIQTVLVEVGLPLRLVPYDFHRNIL